MAELLSFLSWNVENFHNQPARVDRVIDAVVAHDPDVFALYEVKGAAVFQSVTNKMPGYSFFITESPGVPEILVGTRDGLGAFVTQRDELQSKVPTLRPGALVTVQVSGSTYSLLFLHLKSFQAPRDWGLRDDMFKHVASLKRRLDGAAPDGAANFIALGDINTMGLSAPYNNSSDFDAATELAFVDARMGASHTRMRRLAKTEENTWWGGGDTGPSSLDHVYASEHLSFESHDNGRAEVLVSGWINEPTKAKKLRWINRFSDHCILTGRVVE